MMTHRADVTLTPFSLDSRSSRHTCPKRLHFSWPPYSSHVTVRLTLKQDMRLGRGNDVTQRHRCARRLCMRPVWVWFFASDTTVSQDRFKNSKEWANISGSPEGHGALQGRGIGIYSPSRSGIKLSPFLSWRSCEGCLRGKWQPADSSKHFPHSVTATESAHRRVCCLGNSMTLDPAVDVLGFFWGGDGSWHYCTCSPHLSYHWGVLCKLSPSPSIRIQFSRLDSKYVCIWLSKGGGNNSWSNINYINSKSVCNKRYLHQLTVQNGIGA